MKSPCRLIQEVAHNTRQISCPDLRSPRDEIVILVVMELVTSEEKSLPLPCNLHDEYGIYWLSDAAGTLYEFHSLFPHGWTCTQFENVDVWSDLNSFITITFSSGLTSAISVFSLLPVLTLNNQFQARREKHGLLRIHWYFQYRFLRRKWGSKSDRTLMHASAATFPMQLYLWILIEQ